MAKKRILIIDDEAGFTEMVKFNLELTGEYEVIVENHAACALDTALECKPNLILLDVIMPETEGPDVVNQLRGNKFLKDIPIIFLTATIRKNEAIAEKGKIGGFLFLAKPGSVKELIACIEDELARVSSNPNPDSSPK